MALAKRIFIIWLKPYFLNYFILQLKQEAINIT